MRGIKAPVALIGTSRGAVWPVPRLHTAQERDGPIRWCSRRRCVSTGDKAPNFQMAAGNPARAALPTLLLGHKKDACRWTLVSTFDRFKQWHGGKVEVIVLDGPDGSGDPCEAQSAHGFIGIDAVVVSTVTQWIKGQSPAAR